MDHQERDALFPVQLQEQIGQSRRAHAVQGAGGFVGQHQRGRVDQRASDRRPLRLAAGELAGEVAQALFQADPLQKPPRPVFDGLRPVGFRTSGQRRHENVFEHGELRKQVMALKDPPDSLATNAGEFGRRQVRERRAVEGHGSGIGRVERPEDLQQGRLAAAARPDDRRHRARLQRQIDAAKYIARAGKALPNARRRQ